MSELLPAVRNVQLSLDDLAAEANREHALCREAAYSMVRHAVAAGQALNEAKAEVNHGDWLPWLEAKFDGSERTARLYMYLDSNRQRIADLNLWTLGMNAIQKRLARVNRESSAPEIEAEYVYDNVRIRHGDLRTALDDLTGEVDAIITDPPYPLEYLDEFDALGEVAARLLAPGGVLVAMVGQMYLPDYLERLARNGLAYRWCAAYLTPGPARRLHARSFATKWKPLLIFDRADQRRFFTQDVVRSAGDDKAHHSWGQSESGMADIVEHLTEPGDLVVDPFLGGGTTAIVCRDLGRRFVGCDIDAAAVDTTRKRLAE